jgi:hypothetical protein
MMDTTINSIETRFRQLSLINESWSFLYDMNKTDESLEEDCLKLEKKLTHDHSRDISGFCREKSCVCRSS